MSEDTTPRISKPDTRAPTVHYEVNENNITKPRVNWINEYELIYHSSIDR